MNPPLRKGPSGPEANLDSSDIINVSNVLGDTVTEALDNLATGGAVTTDSVTNVSDVPGTNASDALDDLQSRLTTDGVTNLSDVPGVNTSDALEDLQAEIDFLAAALANLGTSSVQNQSGVPGATATDALDALNVIIGALTSSDIQNVSVAAGATVTNALDSLVGSINALAAVVAALDSSDIANVSFISGATVTNALQSLATTIGSLDTNDIANVSSVPGGSLTAALDALLTLIQTLDSSDIQNVSAVPGATVTQALDALYGNPGFPSASPPGLVGADGEDGWDGMPGATGATGAPGAPGALGFAGLDGEDGWDGMPGAVGPIGPAGAPGALGFAGLDGEDGWDGMPGATGATGAPGAPGALGFAGLDGEDGWDGMPGSVGPMGPAGAPGAVGLVGADGEDGWDGLPGPIGPQGPQGPQGIPGIQGEEGEQGLPGPPGPIVPWSAVLALGTGSGPYSPIIESGQFIGFGVNPTAVSPGQVRADGAFTLRGNSTIDIVTPAALNITSSTIATLLGSTAAFVQSTSPVGNVFLQPATGRSVLFPRGFMELTEQAASTPVLTAGQGLYWVKNDAPNNPYFTDDTNVDRRLATVPIPLSDLGDIAGVSIVARVNVVAGPVGVLTSPGPFAVPYDDGAGNLTFNLLVTGCYANESVTNAKLAKMNPGTQKGLQVDASAAAVPVDLTGAEQGQNIRYDTFQLGPSGTNLDIVLASDTTVLYFTTNGNSIRSLSSVGAIDAGREVRVELLFNNGFLTFLDRKVVVLPQYQLALPNLEDTTIGDVGFMTLRFEGGQWRAVAWSSGKFKSNHDGLVPASGGGTVTWLRADGTWATGSDMGDIIRKTSAERRSLAPGTYTITLLATTTALFIDITAPGDVIVDIVVHGSASLGAEVEIVKEGNTGRLLLLDNNTGINSIWTPGATFGSPHIILQAYNDSVSIRNNIAPTTLIQRWRSIGSKLQTPWDLQLAYLLSTNILVGTIFTLDAVMVAGAAGAGDVVVLSGNLTFGFKILRTLPVITVGFPAGSITARNATGGGGAAVSSTFVATAANDAPAITANIGLNPSIAALGTLVVRRSDGAITGEVVFLCMRT